MQLVELLDGEDGLVTPETATAAKEITGLTCDSRQVEPGFLFAAIPGTQADGRAFIPDAMARGAVAVLAPPGTEIDGDEVSLVVDDNPRRGYALMAANFYAAQPATVAAVTGTNGKTSVAAFLRQIWAALGHHAASAGTLGIELGGYTPGTAPALRHGFKLTTPDCVDLHRGLAELAELDIQHLAMEASSHGLQQHRLDGVRVTAAAFTNLTRDHLDYHGTMADYLNAKLRLFTELLIDGGTAVINADDVYADAVRSASQGRGLRILDHGRNGEDVRLLEAQPQTHGQSLRLRVFGEEHHLDLPLVGEFQAHNALSALCLAVASNADPDQAIAALPHLSGVPGRVELAATHPNGASAYVDYAHTPDALASVLKALRPHTRGRLHVVFGCGGDRDPGKRPEMGAVACKYADRRIVTDDNPRTEDPADIRRQARAGCPEAEDIGDRADAITEAVHGLQPDDILVVAGKGHETGQIVGDDVLPFHDAEVIRAAVGSLSA